MANTVQRLTEADYLALERASDQKHEFFAGVVFAMGGGSEAHNLREHVLVAQDRPRVERYTRQGEEEDWLLAEVSDPARRITLGSVGCELAMTEVYEEIEFPETPSLRIADVSAHDL